ncbi:MAG: arylamine N-acetyltransferase [Variibacter sp.]|nr:arylamine N-acetyltransferase [Variibacter sp.]
MSEQIDLDRYFARVGYGGTTAATLETLRELHRLHPQAIAFENLNPLLRLPVGTDPASIERKLVREGRGGWCFEQNLLFLSVLRRLGFRVTGLAARVLWNQPEDAITPRSHMLLRVDIDGHAYVADVGFGGLTLTAPLLLEPDIEQPTPHEPFRILRAGAYYTLQAKIAGDWKTLYRFDLQEQFVQDYEVSSHFLSTHPSSHFLRNLLAARPDDGRRYALFNNQLTIHWRDRPSQRRVLATAAEIRRALEHEFRLTLPARPDLDAALGNLIPATSNLSEAAPRGR